MPPPRKAAKPPKERWFVYCWSKAHELAPTAYHLGIGPAKKCKFCKGRQFLEIK